jgi:hypothetical protein
MLALRAKSNMNKDPLIRENERKIIIYILYILYMRKCSPLFVEGWYVWETLALELGYLRVIETELLSRSVDELVGP